jgi:mannose-6-phosphate isomerase-like protein (cupin superfamily)
VRHPENQRRIARLTSVSRMQQIELAKRTMHRYRERTLPSAPSRGQLMQRREFLQTAAAVFPAATLPEFLAAQSSAVQSAPSNAQDSAQPPVLQVVGANEDRFGHPHTLGYSTILFKVATADTDGRLFLIEHQHAMPGGGPPLHFHLNQEEWFYVMEGEVAFQVGDKRLRLQAGESALAPRRVPHTFSPVGQGPAYLLIAFTPAGKMEQFFRDAQPLNQPAEVLATLFHRYEMEYVGPSPFSKT